MNEFIQLVSQQLGVSAETSKSATGGMLGLLKDKLEGGDFSKLVTALPGAEQLVPTGAKAGAQGALGGLMGAVSGALGGGGGGSLGALAQLAGTGLKPEQIGTFASLFLGFVKSKAGQDLVAKILGSIPELKAFVK